MVGFSRTKTFENDALLRVLALDAQVFEIARVPERVEVALDRDRIVGVARMGEHAGENGFLGDAPVADDADLIRWYRAFAPKLPRARRQGQQQKTRASALDGRMRAGDGSVLDLHRV